jgi:hypothetical protein
MSRFFHILLLTLALGGVQANSQGSSDFLQPDQTKESFVAALTDNRRRFDNLIRLEEEGAV